MSTKEHISFILTSDVADICKPLKEYLKIDYFHFQKNYLDRHNNRVKAVAPLSSNTAISEFIYHFPRGKRAPCKYDLNQTSHYHLFSSVDPKFAQILNNNCKLNSVICKSEVVSPAELDYFLFGTTSNDPNVIDLYLNHRDYFDKFIIYFKEKAAKLIAKTCEHKVYSGREISSFNKNPKLPSQEFLKIIEPKHFLLINNSNEKIPVPAAEMRSLELLARGRSAKETAKILNISYRTVESNWNRSKTRLKCLSTFELISVIEKNKSLKLL